MSDSFDAVCGNCRYWFATGHPSAIEEGAHPDGELGTCHFNPPTVHVPFAGTPMTVWPQTHGLCWCRMHDDAPGPGGDPDDGEKVEPDSLGDNVASLQYRRVQNGGRPNLLPVAAARRRA